MIAGDQTCQRPCDCFLELLNETPWAGLGLAVELNALQLCHAFCPAGSRAAQLRERLGVGLLAWQHSAGSSVLEAISKWSAQPTLRGRKTGDEASAQISLRAGIATLAASSTLGLGRFALRKQAKAGKKDSSGAPTKNQ
eukprot:4638084-Amphidinium_carterae.1